ncbi:MAG: ABC transporter permease [Nitrosomonas sp.]
MNEPVVKRLFSLVALCVCIIFLFPIIPSQDPLAINLDNKLLAPSAHYMLGTDELGRDLLSRLLVGVSSTLSVSLAALIVSAFFGIVMGALAGYYHRRWFDTLFVGITNFLSSLPALLIVAAVLGVWGSSLVKAYVVLTALMWVAPARIMRAEVIREARLDYVSATRAMGASDRYIIFKSILPNCMSGALLFSMSYFPEIIALEAGLSFLGFGIQPPQPSLGRMIFDGVGQLYAAWWMALFPALALTLIVFSAMLIGRSKSREKSDE